MASVHFTLNLRRHVETPTLQVPGQTVRQVLEAVFGANPKIHGYVVDERWALRKHMVIFVDGQGIVDRDGLSDMVKPDSEIYVMQALSGG